MVLFESAAWNIFAELAEPALVTFDCLLSANDNCTSCRYRRICMYQALQDNPSQHDIYNGFSSPKAPAASIAAISSGDKAKAQRSELLQTVDRMKPTYITCRNVTLQARLL